MPLPKDADLIFQTLFAETPGASLEVARDVGAHCQRVQQLLTQAVQLSILEATPYFESQQLAAAFHDVAKMAIPPKIYFAPKLTAAQFKQYIHPHPAMALHFLGKGFVDSYPISAFFILNHHIKYGDRRHGERRVNISKAMRLPLDQLILCDCFVASIEPRGDHQTPHTLTETLNRTRPNLLEPETMQANYSELYELGLSLINQP